MICVCLQKDKKQCMTSQSWIVLIGQSPIRAMSSVRFVTFQHFWHLSGDKPNPHFISCLHLLFLMLYILLFQGHNEKQLNCLIVLLSINKSFLTWLMRLFVRLQKYKTMLFMSQSSIACIVLVIDKNNVRFSTIKICYFTTSFAF